MPRQYGKNWFSMWTDEDFCTGTVFDKLCYQVLLGQSGTNDAGICPINFRKWRKALRNGDDMPDEIDVKVSLLRQEARRYVFTDEDTGEVLIRSHIRRDQVYKEPAVLVSAFRDLAACESAKFAVVMLGELERIEIPEVNTEKDYGRRLRKSLDETYTAARDHLLSLASGSTEPFPRPFVDDFAEGFPEPFPRPSHRPSSGGSTEPSQRPYDGGSARPAEIDLDQRPSTGGSSRPPVVVEVEVVPESLVTTPVSNKNKNMLKTDVSSDHTTDAVNTNNYPAAFERWWEHYPRKIGKRKALAAWRSARKRATEQELIDGAKRYAENMNHTEAKFIKYAEGWLGRDGWLDENMPTTNTTTVDWDAL